MTTTTVDKVSTIDIDKIDLDYDGKIIVADSELQDNIRKMQERNQDDPNEPEDLKSCIAGCGDPYPSDCHVA